MSRIQVTELEDRILVNKEYLLEAYPSTEMILSQISMILDFGMNSNDIKKWLEFNKIAINIINEQLERRIIE